MGEAGETSLEALTALRQYLIEHRSAPPEDGDEYVLGGGVRWGKTVKTPLNSANKFLPLNALVHFYSTADGPIKDYITSSRRLDVLRVMQPDKVSILAYLKGEAAWCKQIRADESGASGSAAAAAAATATAAASAAAAPAAAAAVAPVAPAGEGERKRGSASAAAPDEALLRRVKKREGASADRDSVLQSSSRFLEALAIERECRKKSMAEKSGAVVGGSKGRAGHGGMPIIVVPVALTAPLNMFNAREFFEKGRYVATETARGANPVKEQSIIIEKAIGGGEMVRFKVVDSVRKFQDQHWDRLAAVVTHGPTWQFKDWRWKDTATIFDHCRGLHLFFDDGKLEPHVRQWNVITFPIKRQSRDKDAQEMHRMWQEIESFLIKKKPGLLEAGRFAARQPAPAATNQEDDDV